MITEKWSYSLNSWYKGVIRSENGDLIAQNVPEHIADHIVSVHNEWVKAQKFLTADVVLEAHAEDTRRILDAQLKSRIRLRGLHETVEEYEAAVFGVHGEWYYRSCTGVVDGDKFDIALARNNAYNSWWANQRGISLVVDAGIRGHVSED